MAKVQYKHKEGALHIGGGRFFYANEPVEVTEKERAELLENYSDLEEVFEEVPEEKEEEKAKPGKQKASK
jgi:predicted transcriptional regulator